VSDLQALRDKKQEIKDRRSKVLRTLYDANAELRDITDEFLAVDLEIRLEEGKQNGNSTS
jgi:hypothetical protein